jgi:hypothetical protein
MRRSATVVRLGEDTRKNHGEDRDVVDRTGKPQCVNSTVRRGPRRRKERA